VLLNCAGKTNRDGKISISWRGPPDGHDIGPFDTFRTQLENGSLYISSVEESRGITGAYRCLLSLDGIGSIVSRSAHLNIYTFPEVNQDSSEIYAVIGSTAFLKCISSLSTTNGQKYPNYTVSWIKDNAPLRFDETRMTLMSSGSLEIDELVQFDRGD
jgi:neogenin